MSRRVILQEAVANAGWVVLTEGKAMGAMPEIASAHSTLDEALEWISEHYSPPGGEAAR